MKSTSKSELIYGAVPPLIRAISRSGVEAIVYSAVSSNVYLAPYSSIYIYQLVQSMSGITHLVINEIIYHNSKIEKVI